MPIVVSHDPSFGNVAPVAYSAGYGIYQQKQAEIMRDQMNRNQEMAFKAQQAAFDRQQDRIRLAAQLHAQQIGIQADQQSQQQAMALRNQEFQQNQALEMYRAQQQAAAHQQALEQRNLEFQQQQAQQQQEAMQQGLKSGTLKYTQSQKMRQSEIYNQFDKIDSDPSLRQVEREYAKRTLQQELDGIRPRPVPEDEIPKSPQEIFGSRFIENEHGKFLIDSNGNIKELSGIDPIKKAETEAKIRENQIKLEELARTKEEKKQAEREKAAAAQAKKRVAEISAKAKAHDVDVNGWALENDITERLLSGNDSPSEHELEVNSEIEKRTKVTQDYNTAKAEYIKLRTKLKSLPPAATKDGETATEEEEYKFEKKPTYEDKIAALEFLKGDYEPPKSSYEIAKEKQQVEDQRRQAFSSYPDGAPEVKPIPNMFPVTPAAAAGQTKMPAPLPQDYKKTIDRNGAKDRWAGDGVFPEGVEIVERYGKDAIVTTPPDDSGMRHYYVYLGDSKRYQVLDGDGKGGWVNTGYGANLPAPRPVTARDVPEHYMETEKYLDDEMKALGIKKHEDYGLYLKAMNTPEANRKLGVLGAFLNQRAADEKSKEEEKKSADERMREKIKAAEEAAKEGDETPYGLI